MIAQFITREVERGLKQALRPLAEYLRMLALGSGLVIVSTVGYLFALAFGSVGIYFTLLDRVTEAGAAFWLGGGWLVIGVGLMLLGLNRIRPPR
jgi:hypothetical protein